MTRTPALRLAAGLVSLLSLSACTRSASVDPAASLARLRDRARGTREPEPRRDRALAELVAPGGDLAVAERELLALGPRLGDDPRVRFGSALIEIAHGSFAAGAQDLAGCIAAAQHSSDPLAPALAEVSVGKLVALRGTVRDFDRRFVPLVDAIVRDPGRLGPAATSELLETAVRWARERGNAGAQQRWIRASGCATEWSVAGAFGPLPMLRFDEVLAPELPGPLSHDYDVGPGRGRRAVWQVRARGCAANLGEGRSENGVFVAASDFDLDRDVRVVLGVESPNVFAVLVDGVTVATVDGRIGPTPAGTQLPLDLVAGHHTLRVKIASRYSSPLLIATLTDPTGRPVARWRPAQGAAHPRPPVVPTPPRSDGGSPLDPFARYVAAELAFARKDPITARELARPLAEGRGVTALANIAWASIALADPYTAQGVGRDRARRALEAAARADRRAYYPLLALARLAAADDRADAALALLRDADARHPDNPEVQSDLAEQLIDRGWDGEASAVLQRASSRLPEACWPVRLQLSLAQKHGDGQSERALAERVRGCDALADVAAVAALRERRWDDAQQEYARLLADDPEGRGLRRALVDVARQRGDLSAATHGAERLLPENPEDTSLRADLADLIASAGRTDAAIALLDREIARAPTTMTELFRYRDALGAPLALAPWRLDGTRVLREFTASGRRYDAAAVLVLDYTVRRAMADGSALELTHNIVRLQSQEGVDEHATFSPPQGATLLTLRTHKSDGRVLEPDAIARLDAVAFPDVRIGDAVEFEYVRALPVSDTAPDGFTTDRFYFRGFDSPYDRSEFVMVAPRALAERIRIDPRGPAPRMEHRDLQGSLVEYRWVARESQRMTPEPRPIAAREFVPSVVVAAGASWPRFVDALRDRLADMDPFDPDAARLARRIVGGASRPSEKLARLHRWVVDHIEQDGVGTPFAAAPVMVSARSGHRARVLCYLLGLEGVRCRMALVRQASADATVTDVADDETYPSVMLRVSTERGERWVSASDRGAPVAWIPPVLAGQMALVLDRGAPQVRLPAFDPAAHTREITVRLVLARDGSARADVVERLRGEWALSWRGSLRQIDPANLEREFESYVGRQVAAASLTSLRIEGQDNPEADLVLRYALTAPNVALVQNGALVFDGVYLAELSPTYAQLPRRTVTMYNPEALRASLDLRVELPDGARLGELPAPHAGRAVGIEWSVRHERSGSGFRYQRQVSIPPGRIRPEAYVPFATQIRAMDAADTQRVIIPLR